VCQLGQGVEDLHPGDLVSASLHLKMTRSLSLHHILFSVVFASGHRGPKVSSQETW
jgi:hypothetical protein